MKSIALVLLCACGASAQIVWTKRNPAGKWPAQLGWYQMQWDPVAGKVANYGATKKTGTVTVTNGSTTVNWASGDKFSLYWLPADPDPGVLRSATPIIVNAQTVEIASVTTDTQLELESAWAGANGTYAYSAAVSSNIFATNMSWYDWDTGAYVYNPLGTWSLVHSCAGDPPDAPPDRHPAQQAIDTLRGRLWLYSGVCSNNERFDMWWMNLSANPPAGNTWTEVTGSLSTFPSAIWSGMTYSPDDDLLFMFGSDGGPQTETNWVYCPGSTLTAAHKAAGCAGNNNWYKVFVVGGTQPPGLVSPRVIYDPDRHKVLMFGGMSVGGTLYNDVWEYDIPSKTWTDRNATGSPPMSEDAGGQIALDRNTEDGKFYLHVNPMDYTSTHLVSDWVYDYDTNEWTELGNLGGPTFTATMVYDPIHGALMAWGRNANEAEMWVGQFPIPPVWVSTSPLQAGNDSAQYIPVQLEAESPSSDITSWEITDGTFPPGLTLDEETGEITGIPNAPGVYTFEITATNDTGPRPKTFEITIGNAITKVYHRGVGSFRGAAVLK